jgi:hypothetical protein
MSLPVLAHEFGHRLFFKNVFQDDESFDVWRSRLDTSLSSDAKRANRMLQGIDEGLADLFSLAVTGDVGAVPQAFAQAKGVFEAEADRRHLERAYADAATYEGLRDLTIDASFLQECGANGDSDLDQTMPAVIAALADLGERLKEDGALFDADLLLEPIAARADAPQRAALCAAFRERFSTLVTPERVPSCP